MKQTEEEITFASITAKSAMTSMQFTLNTILSNADEVVNNGHGNPMKSQAVP